LVYTSRAALATALRRHPARVVRLVAPLHVAEVRPIAAPAAFVESIRHEEGISSVRATASRVSAARPALALGAAPTPAGGAFEWQYYATALDRVPATILAAARRFTIGVVDTGADLSTPGLASKVVGAYDVRRGVRSVPDENGHGTFVASIAAGASGDGGGIVGFGGDARLLLVKVGSSSFNDVDVAAGIIYAVRHGAQIINLSIAGRTRSPVEESAVEYAARRGVLLVAAAGNEALDGNPPEYPAALLQPVGSSGVGGLGLAVGASGFDGQRAPFSEFGSFVSLAAPGLSVFGAVATRSMPAVFPRTGLQGATVGLYGFASGTSFAAPQVAGAAALVWAANPSLSAQGVAEILKQTASGKGSWSPQLGFGVIDIAAAVEQALAIAARA
jgi:subtilisin family serine protease